MGNDELFHCLHSFWSTAQRRAWCETFICDVGIGTTVVWQMPLRESQRRFRIFSCSDGLSI